MEYIDFIHDFVTIKFMLWMTLFCVISYSAMMFWEIAKIQKSVNTLLDKMEAEDAK
jgi:tryptophan-rich sensory protein